MERALARIFLLGDIFKKKKLVILAHLTYTAHPPNALAAPWNSAVSCLLWKIARVETLRFL